MSGKHSQPDRTGRKTDTNGDVINMSGRIEEPASTRPYVPVPETKGK